MDRRKGWYSEADTLDANSFRDRSKNPITPISLAVTGLRVAYHTFGDGVKLNNDGTPLTEKQIEHNLAHAAFDLAIEELKESTGISRILVLQTVMNSTSDIKTTDNQLPENEKGHKELQLMS